MRLCNSTFWWFRHFKTHDSLPQDSSGSAFQMEKLRLRGTRIQGLIVVPNFKKFVFKEEFLSTSREPRILQQTSHRTETRDPSPDQLQKGSQWSTQFFFVFFVWLPRAYFFSDCFATQDFYLFSASELLLLSRLMFKPLVCSTRWRWLEVYTIIQALATYYLHHDCADSYCPRSPRGCCGIFLNGSLIPQIFINKYGCCHWRQTETTRHGQREICRT